MTRFSRKLFFSLILVVLIFADSAQSRENRAEDEEFELRIENIMKGPELVGSEPSSIIWSWSGKNLYFRWKKPGEEKTEFYRVATPDGNFQQIGPEDLLKDLPFPSSAPSSFRFSRFFFGLEINYDREKKKALLVRDGDISLLDTATGEVVQLTSTDEPESNASFAFDQQKIFFTCQDNLFLLSLKDHSLRQMTSFTRKPPPAGERPDEIKKWYRDQQMELFQEFQQERRGREERRPLLSFGEVKKRKPFHLREGQGISNLQLSPDEKSVVFMLWESLPGAQETIVPSYVTRSGYTETINSHTKAAHSSRTSKAGIMDVSSGEVRWVDYGQGEKTIYPSGLFWSPDGKKCVLEASSEDRKDKWLFLLDLSTGKTSPIEHVHDEAWVGMLGLTSIGWFPDSRHLYYISEKEGYAHLFKASFDGKTIAPLTRGSFEVRRAFLSGDGRTWYLTTNEEHPGELHFYSMPVEGGKRTKVTSLTGLNEVLLSPDESQLAVIHSSSIAPPELYLQPNSPDAEARQLTLSTSEEFRSHPWHEPEVITFKARDGVDVHARLYRPRDWHPRRPAVVFIHGAGYLQNAHKGWSTYSREYMFHNFLIENGYLVLDVDYRGSAGYGRDFRTSIYRHMGGKDLDDIVDAARFLVKELKANPESLGVYGGSYGGFLTLMAMFKAPGVFHAGAALRPVTDWAHYHPGYTVDILNRPQDDPLAYKQSSPIYLAEGLQGALLICHGMVDTNVHFQDTARLVQRLIELGKENWEAAIYPVEGHSFRNSSSWTDEYKRIFKLFRENLK